VVDAIGGGGWGPIATPTLLTATKMSPRHVIGSVDTSELAVSVAASLGFLLGIGAAGIDATIVLALLAGGVVAAPFAAWLVRVLPTTVLGIGVGGLLLLTNARTLVRLHELSGALVYPTISVGLLVAAAYAARQWGNQASSSSIRSASSPGS